MWLELKKNNELFVFILGYDSYVIVGNIVLVYFNCGDMVYVKVW